MSSEKDFSKTKEPHKISFVTFLQSLYLTIAHMGKNDLFSYASSCAFGFLFSLIPTVMMVLVILMQIFHASPDILFSFLEKYDFFSQFFSTENLRNSIAQLRGFGLFEIVISIAIIMMARRFFSSVNKSLNRIFKAVVKPQPVVQQLLIFAGEAVIVIILSLLVSAIGILRAILRMPFFVPFIAQFSDLIIVLTERLTATLPNVLIFLAVTFCYRIWSQSKPSWFICALASAACTFIFWAFTKLTGIFINMTNFNLVYGVLSNSIVLLLEVQVFFMLLLFFGQYIFVIQFFDTLLLAELYTLPHHDDTNIGSALRRTLFIRPDHLIQNNKTATVYHEGDCIFKPGDSTRNMFYIAKGIVQEQGATRISYHEPGSFFGEESCLLTEPRNSTAIAKSEVLLVTISEEEFLSLLEKNTEASQRALSKVSTYFGKFYGRTAEYQL